MFPTSSRWPDRILLSPVCVLLQFTAAVGSVSRVYCEFSHASLLSCSVSRSCSLPSLLSCSVSSFVGDAEKPVEESGRWHHQHRLWLPRTRCHWGEPYREHLLHWRSGVIHAGHGAGSVSSVLQLCSGCIPVCLSLSCFNTTIIILSQNIKSTYTPKERQSEWE